jgi:hypothetical protein
MIIWTAFSSNKAPPLPGHFFTCTVLSFPIIYTIRNTLSECGKQCLQNAQPKVKLAASLDERQKGWGGGGAFVISCVSAATP